jgi:uncharacterized membrane protein YgcG
MMAIMAAAATAAVAGGRTTTEGCVCRVCANPNSPRTIKAQHVCLRIEAQRVASTHPIGAMLALQGPASVGHSIEIYWPLDQVHYRATITSYDPVELQHMVMYEADGVREFLCLWNEDVKVLDGPAMGERPAPSAPRDHGEKPGATSTAAAAGLAAAAAAAAAASVVDTHYTADALVTAEWAEATVAEAAAAGMAAGGDQSGRDDAGGSSGGGGGSAAEGGGAGDVGAAGGAGASGNSKAEPVIAAPASGIDAGGAPEDAAADMLLGLG